MMMPQRKRCIFHKIHPFARSGMVVCCSQLLLAIAVYRPCSLFVFIIHILRTFINYLQENSNGYGTFLTTTKYQFAICCQKSKSKRIR